MTMARPGVTYQDIVSAVHELNGQGKSITIENIRLHLGTGSIGTINKYLRQWREIQASTDKIPSKENLPNELVSLMKGLWESVLTQSEHQFEPVETNYLQEITELKSQLEKYRTSNRRWQKLFTSWQQEKSRLDNELQMLIEKSQTEIEWFKQQLLEAKKQIDSLQVQNNLLANDKCVLGQEKAQLEGRLKQLHKEAQV